MERSIVKFSDNTLFSNFLERIGDEFCPYIRPAENNNTLFVSHYDIPDYGDDLLKTYIFYISVLHTEQLRQQRRESKSGKALLICDNVYFTVQSEREIDFERLLSWPHWMLKNLYLKVGIMFGKFAIGQQRVGRNGKSIDSPPIHFISIRSAIKEKDPYFFKKTPEILDDLLNSIDDGRNVHGILGFTPKSLDELVEADYFVNLLSLLSNETEDNIKASARRTIARIKARGIN